MGAGEVLPGRGPGHEVNLSDDRVIDEFEELLAAGGSSASLSGEEYRRRLFGALGSDSLLRSDMQALPFGSGSGFESDLVAGNGYVFCVRIGSSPKPWFRYVAADEQWRVKTNEHGVPVISADTLTALRVADPQDSSKSRWLPDDVYDHAFDAWSVARDDCFATWSSLTDPSALEPDLPLSFSRCLLFGHSVWWVLG